MDGWMKQMKRNNGWMDLMDEKKKKNRLIVNGSK
jgi:hypothetical protein